MPEICYSAPVKMNFRWIYIDPTIIFQKVCKRIPAFDKKLNHTSNLSEQNIEQIHHTQIRCNWFSGNNVTQFIESFRHRKNHVRVDRVTAEEPVCELQNKGVTRGPLRLSPRAHFPRDFLINWEAGRARARILKINLALSARASRELLRFSDSVRDYHTITARPTCVQFSTACGTVNLLRIFVYESRMRACTAKIGNSKFAEVADKIRHTGMLWIEKACYNRARTPFTD